MKAWYFLSRNARKAMRCVQISDFRAKHGENPTLKTVKALVGKCNVNSLTWSPKALTVLNEYFRHHFLLTKQNIMV